MGLARGYLNRPEKTAEAFIANPFRDFVQAISDLKLKDPNPLTPNSTLQSLKSPRLYKTGDLACYRRDGHIRLLGRLDHQVKIRGFRIEPGEIEARLSQHPDVRERVVIVRQNQSGEKRLIAYAAVFPDRTPTTRDLHRFIAQKLPKYMTPAVFVLLDALPLNPNGKVDRAALPAPDTLRPDLTAPFIPPRTSREVALTDIFAEVLEVEQVRYL